MTTRAAVRGFSVFAGVFLLACVTMATGCGRPPDEAWLQFLGFEQGGKTIGVFGDALREESTETVDVAFENGSLNVGQKIGTGVLVNRARIDYRMAGFSPPSAELPVNLYIGAPADGKPVKGTLTDFPLVPESLKQWIIDTGAFDDAAAKPVVDLTANVTFYGQTDEGDKLETEGGIRIALTNSGGISAVTEPEVIVKWSKHAVIFPVEPGKFVVFRTGDFAVPLTVEYTITSTGLDGSYAVSPSTTSVTIPASYNSAEVTITPLPTATTSDTVTITLKDTADYSLGFPKTTSLEIN